MKQMDSERWARVQELFHAAAKLPPAERRTWVESQCGGDAHTVDPVIAMLAVDEETGESVLDRGMDEIATDVIGDGMDFEDFPFPRSIGPYELQSILGEGGMGVVCLAERTDVGNQVAIKLLIHAGLSPARRERFMQEIRTLARLQHPYIARLYDTGSLPDGTPWFVMEYVEGDRLMEYCNAPGRTIQARLELFRSICQAVEYAHRERVVHRDLKPSNILVKADGTPRLLDFGIARELQQVADGGEATAPGPRFMTAAYAAPEWIREGTVGFSTDVYALGVILYELLCGQLPFTEPKSPAGSAPKGCQNDGSDRLQWPQRSNPSGFGDKMLAGAAPEKPSAVIRRQLQKDVEAKLSGTRLTKEDWNDLDKLCLTAMHADAEERYRSVEALLRDIDHFLRREPLEKRPGTLGYRVRRFLQRNQGKVLAAAAVFALVVLLVVAFTVRLAKARNAALAEAARTQRIQRFMLSLFQGGDAEAGPSGELKVVSMIDRGVLEAESLSAEPRVQAELFRTLGTMYQKLGQLNKAEALLERAMRQEKALAQGNGQISDAEMTDIQIALATLRSDQGRYPEAMKLASDALKAANSAPMSDAGRALRAKTEAAMGHVLVAGGKYADGADHLNRALSLQPANAAETAELAQVLTDLGDADMYEGKVGNSFELNQRALQINRKLFGDSHPMVSENLRNLAQADENWGKYAEAEKLERQALAINTSWYGKTHPATASAMTTLAETLVLDNVNQYAEAGDLLHRALAIQEAAYGPNHPRVAYVVNALGSLALEQRDFHQAEEDDRRVVEIYRTAYSDGDYRVAVATGNLASVYAAEKNLDMAATLLKEVVQRLLKAQGPDSPNTAMSQIRLGRTLAREGKFSDAEPYTRAGYEVLRKQPGAQPDFLLGARTDLAIIYEKLNRTEDAKRFRDELATANTATAKAASK